MSQELEQTPYATPASQLQVRALAQNLPSIDEALARGYDFSIGELLGEAWRRVKGIKGTLIAGLIVYGVALNLLGFVFGFILGMAGLLHGHDSGSLSGNAVQGVIGIIAGAICYPLLAGLNMIGIRRAADQPASINEVFSYFSLFAPLFITGLAVSVLVYLGFLLLVLPGVYLGIAYALALPLVVERRLSPWQAMEASRKAINRHWFKVFGLFLVLGLILLLSIIPLGIGLVWSLPLTFIAIGGLYRTIFGVLPAAN